MIAQRDVEPRGDTAPEEPLYTVPARVAPLPQPVGAAGVVLPDQRQAIDNVLPILPARLPQQAQSVDLVPRSGGTAAPDGRSQAPLISARRAVEPELLQASVSS